ncbi:MAG TPA: AIR synthase-related protein, partial [Devosia sp.]|nr:AIR synthase-related protein [Devosia sp.]
PVRETHMTAYEMMLSESQERMLMVLHPAKEAEARAVFVKWELDFATVGKTTDDLRFRVLWQGEEVANLPIKDLGDEAPEYDRPWVATRPPAPLAATDIPQMDVADALLALVGGHQTASRRWVYEQYDTLIQGNSLQRPGGEAGVIRVDGHPTKALAFTSDVTPRYCEADPYEGGKQAVAEAWRNLTATGADPLAATDNLNFGNPERPEIMGQLVGAIKGIGEACLALDFPIVSGNVSLYNETNGRGILPTPTIGGVGLLPDWAQMARIGFAAENQVILLVGSPADRGSHLAQSIYMRDLFDRKDGPPPPVDLVHERRTGDFVRKLIRSGIATAVHDLSDGGLAVGLAEMAMASGIGANVTDITTADPIPQFFGEDQGRYLVTVNLDPQGDEIVALWDEAKALGIHCPWIGSTGGTDLILGDARPVAVAALKAAHEGWFPNYMAGQ